MERKRSRLFGLALILTWLVVGKSPMEGIAQGQEQAFEQSVPEGGSPDGVDRLTRIEEQLQKLEAHNQRLQRRYTDLSRKYESLLQQGNDPIFGARAGNADGVGIPGGVNLQQASFLQEQNRREQSGESGAGEPVGARRRSYEPEGEEEEEGAESQPGEEARVPRRRAQSGTSGGAGEILDLHGPGMMSRYVDRRGPYVRDMRPLKVPGSVEFSEGLEIRAADDFFTLEFHNLTQMDYRQFSRTGDALHDNFLIPRQRWYFQGQVSPYAYYYTVINRGYGSLDILDAWTDFNFAPKYKEHFQVRAGRMKVPYSYEYIKISESDLIAPERSLFIGNFAPNREIGIMAHGYLLERMFEYYGGVFNGPRRSFQDYNNSKDIVGFFNTKPFLHSGVEWLENLNLSGSVIGGSEHNPLQPDQLSTANDQSPAASVINVSPTFLTFNNNVIEDGFKMQWSGDLAYYYRSFTLVGAYQGGFQNYALTNAVTFPDQKFYNNGLSAFVGVPGFHREAVPLEGWNIALTYFLTGEQITRRVYLLEPVRPFGYYNGRLNPGAIEVYSRFANLQLGDQVFTGGFANPHLWANRANAIDTGVNWYLNHYVRLYFDWQIAMFNQPVFLATNKFMRTENIYWFRTQIFF